MIKLWQKSFVRAIYFYSSDSDIELVQKPIQYLTNPTNDQLTLLISENIHPLDTIKIYKQYQIFFKLDHYLQAIKTITVSRTSLKYIGNQQVQITLHQMCAKLLEQIDQMDIHQCMEFLHSANRFSGFQLSEKLIKRLQAIQDYSSYNLTQIIKLAQDMYQINMDTKSLFIHIIDRCINDEASIFDLAYLLKMEYFFQFSLQITCRDKIISFFEYLHQKVSYFDIEFQSYLLSIYATRRYYEHLLIIPKIIYVIEKQLQQKIHKMNEQCIIYILTAYKYLPKIFSQDLFNIIQEMFIKAINQSPQKLEIGFLKEIYFNLNLTAEEKLKIHELIKSRAQQSNIKQNFIPQLMAMNMKDVAELVLSNQLYNQDTLLFYKIYFDQNIDKYIEVIDFQDNFKKYLSLSDQNPEKARIREQLLQQCNQKTYKWITKLHHFEFNSVDLEDFILRMSLLIRDKSPDNLQKLLSSYKMGKKIISLIRNKEILDVWIDITSKFKVSFLVEELGITNQFQIHFIKHTIQSNLKNIETSELKILLLLIKPQDFIDDSEFLFKIMKRLETDTYGPIFFLTYLHRHGVDYRNYRFNETHKDRLSELYSQADSDVKLIILYILFFN